MKRLYLTVLRKELTEEAQNKIDSLDNQYGEPLDSDGKNRDYYENLGIRVPQEIVDKERELDNGIELDAEKDFDYYPTECVVRLDQFAMCIDDLDEGSSVFLTDGTFVNVIESAEEIDAQIDWLTRPWYKKLIK